MNKILRSLLFTFLCLIYLTNSTLAQEKKWTFIVYLIGADLESKSDAGTNDIYEIIDAGNTDSVNVVVLTGGADKDGWREPYAQLYSNGTEIPLDFDADGKEMSSAENVTAFIDWSLSKYPGKKVALTFWNHGSDIRGYGNDEVSGSNLTVPKIKEAIGNTAFIKNNNKFELLGFDACLMGNIETVSTLQDYCNWYVGSEEQEPGHGWNYTPIIKALNSADDAYSGRDLGQVIVDGFFAQAADQQTTAVTLGVIDPSKITSLEESLTTLFNAVVDSNKVSKLHKARAKAEEYSKSINNPEYSEDMVDIGDLMLQFKTISPEFSTEIDNVLSDLSQAVAYKKNDMARPKSRGLSMYIPHNVLVDEDELYTVLNTHYYPIDFSLDIRNFMYDVYTPHALSDNNPPSGMHDPDFNFFRSKNNGSSRDEDEVSAIRVSHDDDLEQVQVLLIEELQGFPNEYLMLGSTHPDTVVYNDQGTDVYAYKWDQYWLSINEHPAYISDLFDYEVEDEEGNVSYYTKIHIPAVKNLGQSDEEYLILTYNFDEDFNYELESIIPEPYSDENGNMIVPKQRIYLQLGDQVQLLYEGFNEVTDEEFFVVDDNAIIQIENGNNDLNLDYARLENGNYQIGYHLEDHSKNDTIIFDPTIYTVSSTGLESIQNEGQFHIYPNPSSGRLQIELENGQHGIYRIQVYDAMGRVVFESTSDKQLNNLNLNLASGIYSIILDFSDHRIVDRLVIQK